MTLLFDGCGIPLQVSMGIVDVFIQADVECVKQMGVSLLAWFRNPVALDQRTRTRVTPAERRFDSGRFVVDTT